MEMMAYRVELTQELRTVKGMMQKICWNLLSFALPILDQSNKFIIIHGQHAEEYTK